MSSRRPFGEGATLSTPAGAAFEATPLGSALYNMDAEVYVHALLRGHARRTHSMADARVEIPGSTVLAFTLGPFLNNASFGFIRQESTKQGRKHVKRLITGVRQFISLFNKRFTADKDKIVVPPLTPNNYRLQVLPDIGSTYKR